MCFCLVSPKIEHREPREAHLTIFLQDAATDLLHGRGDGVVPLLVPCRRECHLLLQHLLEEEEQEEGQEVPLHALFSNRLSLSVGRLLHLLSISVHALLCWFKGWGKGGEGRGEAITCL